MAKRIEKIVFKNDDPPPWDFWLDGTPWEITMSDVPSYASLLNFRSNAHLMAKRRGLKLRTKLTDNAIIIQAFDLDD